MNRGAVALGSPPLFPVCETKDCGAHSAYIVSRDGLHMNVCRRCMQELVTRWGWRLER